MEQKIKDLLLLEVSALLGIPVTEVGEVVGDSLGPLGIARENVVDLLINEEAGQKLKSTKKIAKKSELHKRRGGQGRGRAS